MKVHAKIPGLRRAIGDRGAVAIAMVIVLVVLSLIVTGMVLSGARDHDLSARNSEAMRSMYAAEAGVQMAVREVAVGADEDGDGQIGAVAAIQLGAATASVTRSDNGSVTTLTSQATSGSAVRCRQLALQQVAVSGGGQSGGYVEIWNLAGEPGSLGSVNWSAPPNAEGIVREIYFPSRANASARFTGQPSANFAMRITANLDVPSTGTWTFSTASDGASDLSIDGVTLVTNLGSSIMPTVSGSTALTAGVHTLVVRMIEGSGSNGLIASWQGPGVTTTTVIPRSALTTSHTLPGLAVNGTVHFYGDSSITTVAVDGYDSGAGAYGGSNALKSVVVSTNTTASSAWHLTGNAHLIGDAVVGVGGNPNSVISMWSGTISGTRTAATVNKACFIHSPAVALPASSGSVAQWTGNFTFPARSHYSSLTIGGSTMATVSGDCVAQVDGQLSIQDTATLTLTGSSTLTLYVGGAINVYSSAHVNSSAPASRLQIYMTGSSNLQITDQAELSAWVVNPFGSLLVYSKGGASTKCFSGRYWGGAATLTDKSRIHLDLSSSGSSGSGTLQTSITSNHHEPPH